MTVQPPNDPAGRHAGMPRLQLRELEATIGRLRFGVIAFAVVVILSFAVLGALVG